MDTIYNQIGNSYAHGRRTDPEINAQIHAKLQDATSILNVGAGTGSYEPNNVMVTAVEPSEAMLSQRKLSSVSVIQAQAENLPFVNKSFSHCMTVLSMHHWHNRKKAFAEIKRVTRERFVAITWDPNSEPFWLTQDYFPEIHDIDKMIFPSLSEFEQSFENIDVTVLKIPANCIDGFLAAYWRKPQAYLDDVVRANISTFTKISELDKGLTQLQNDISSGAWKFRNSGLLKSEFLDAGYRIVSIDLSGGDDARLENKYEL